MTHTVCSVKTDLLAPPPGRYVHVQSETCKHKLVSCGLTNKQLLTAAASVCHDCKRSVVLDLGVAVPASFMNRRDAAYMVGCIGDEQLEEYGALVDDSLERRGAATDLSLILHHQRNCDTCLFYTPERLQPVVLD